MIDSLNNEQKKIIEDYIKLVKLKNGKYLTIDDLQIIGVTRAIIRRNFKTLKNLTDIVSSSYPDLFDYTGNITAHKTTNKEFNDKKQSVLDRFLKILESKNKSGPVTLKDLTKNGLSRNQIRTYWQGLNDIEEYTYINYKHLYPESYELLQSRQTLSKKDGLKAYLDLRDELKRIPLMKELTNVKDFSRAWYVSNFGGMSDIEEAARKEFPDRFNSYSIRQLKSDKRISELRNITKKHKRFIITTAVTDCEVDMGFYENLKLLAKRKKAKILIMVCSDPARNKYTANKLGHIDRVLADSEAVIIEDTALNSNLFLSTIKLTAKQLNPLTGLERIGKKMGSFVYASPKFFLKYTSVRNSKDKLPHCIMTTGAITKPDYRSEMYMSQRTAYIAEFDHKLGAIYVEIEDDKVYHFRQVQCLDETKAVYLDGKKYSNSKVEDERPEGFVMGDLHVGATCPLTKEVWLDIIRKTKPKRIFLHDVLNGHSINHWIENDVAARAIQSRLGLDSLEAELKMFTKELELWASKCDELVIVPSNHNDWLEKWVRLGKYVRDSRNHYIGLQLAQAAHDGKNLIKFAVEELFKIKANNILWLGRNDDFFIGDVQLNCHGDKGVNGSRGSLAAMETAYGSSVSGHSHTAGIIRDVWAVGTSTHLQEEYNNGASTWTNTSLIIYKNGSRCLYNAIKGKWNDGRNY